MCYLICLWALKVVLLNGRFLEIQEIFLIGELLLTAQEVNVTI
jgi:hypothetical protein